MKRATGSLPNARPAVARDLLIILPPDLAGLDARVVNGLEFAEKLMFSSSGEGPLAP